VRRRWPGVAPGVRELGGLFAGVRLSGGLFPKLSIFLFMLLQTTSPGGSRASVVTPAGAATPAAPAGWNAIVGVGVDAVDVARFRRVLNRRPRLADRCFTEPEWSDATGSADVAQSLAARFAAKEAVMKALGTGIGGFALRDVEVRRAAGTGATRNAPELVLHGSAAELAGARGAGRFHLSLTHTDAVAIAFVVAEQAAPSSCAPS
jgi:holo-[acyl-carrier protein] synthase